MNNTVKYRTLFCLSFKNDSFLWQLVGLLSKTIPLSFNLKASKTTAHKGQCIHATNQSTVPLGSSY